MTFFKKKNKIVFKTITLTKYLYNEIFNHIKETVNPYLVNAPI